MERLISMTDFVLETQKQLHKKLSENYDKLDIPKSYDLIYNYAEFLKQALELWMFVPCDESGNVLEYSKCKENCSCGEEGVADCKEERWNEFQKAKERVLFEGFRFKGSFEGSFLVFRENTPTMIYKTATVEFLTSLQNKVILTETAKKQIGL